MLPHLDEIKSCKKCEHYLPSRHHRYAGECNIHLCAIADDKGEPRASTYPEVSEVWEQFGEDLAAKYCGEYNLKVHVFTNQNHE